LSSSGQFDENTHEWTDGIIPILYRAAVNESAEHESTDKQWIVFDGPVDALWIESMNTVRNSLYLIYTCISIYMYIYINVYVYIYIYIYVFVFIYIYICVYIYIYIDI